jgi:hypothetical protein
MDRVAKTTRLAAAAMRHTTTHTSDRWPVSHTAKRAIQAPYFGGGGAVKISRLRPGSGFGFGLGAFLVSFLPLSLFPMQASMTQKAVHGKVLQSPAFRPDASRAFASALKSGPVRADAADQCWLCRQSQYSFFSSSLRFLKSL